MPKIINKRPLVFVAVALILGVVVASILAKYYAVIFATLGVFLVLGVVLCIGKRYLAMVLAFVFCLGVVLGFFAVSNRSKDVQFKNVELMGRVYEISSEKDCGTYYWLDNLTIEGEDYQGKATIIIDEELNVGDKIKCVANGNSLVVNPLDSYSMIGYYDDIKYEFKATKVEIVDTKILSLREKLVDKIKTMLQDELGDQSGVAIALTLGDKSYMQAETYSDMKVSGISHVFAVSGLHVMTIAGTIYGLMRLLKVNRKISHAIVLATLILYAIVIGFSASIVRAIVMVGVSMIAEFFDRPPDALSRLALASIVITLIKPLAVFELGFQMSFSAILGIICFMPSINKLTDKITIRPLKKIVNAICVTVSAESFLTLILATKFGVVGVYSILSNLILIPLVSLAYILLFSVILACLIFSTMGFLFSPIRYLLLAFSNITSFISGLPSASVNVGLSTASSVILFFALFTLSKYIKLSNVKKLSVFSGLTVVALFLIII